MTRNILNGIAFLLIATGVFFESETILFIAIGFGFSNFLSGIFNYFWDKNS